MRAIHLFRSALPLSLALSLWLSILLSLSLSLSEGMPVQFFARVRSPFLGGGGIGTGGMISRAKQEPIQVGLSVSDPPLDAQPPSLRGEMMGLRDRANDDPFKPGCLGR